MYQIKLTPTNVSVEEDTEEGTASQDTPVSTATTTAPPPPTSTTTNTTNADSARLVKARGAFTRAQTLVGINLSTAETTRLKQDADRSANWKRWGPYLSERQWATVREDYSPNGSW